MRAKWWKATITTTIANIAIVIYHNCSILQCKIYFILGVVGTCHTVFYMSRHYRSCDEHRPQIHASIIIYMQISTAHMTFHVHHLFFFFFRHFHFQLLLCCVCSIWCVYLFPLMCVLVYGVCIYLCIEAMRFILCVSCMDKKQALKQMLVWEIKCRALILW